VYTIYLYNNFYLSHYINLSRLYWQLACAPVALNLSPLPPGPLLHSSSLISSMLRTSLDNSLSVMLVVHLPELSLATLSELPRDHTSMWTPTVSCRLSTTLLTLSTVSVWPVPTFPPPLLPSTSPSPSVPFSTLLAPPP